MNSTYNSKMQSKKVDDLHCESKIWRSNLHFIQDEIIFIDRLLDSYVFEPNTPNLFERIQDYKHRIQRAKNNQAMFLELVAEHERDLGGMLECKDENCDLLYYRKHDKLKAEVIDCIENFKTLKLEIFNYAGGILKKRKPTKE